MITIPDKIKIGHMDVKVISIDQKEADSIGADGLFCYPVSYTHLTVPNNDLV